jgi:hypothetical protein
MVDLHDISTKSELGRPYAYCGDVNLEYGGTFIDTNPADLRYGYANAVRVTDLDSGCGFSGAVLIEHVTVLYDCHRIAEAIACCGWDVRGPAQICDALISYGHSDPDDSWDGYRSNHSEVIQCDQDGPEVFDGWKIDRRLGDDETLEEYVIENHL